MKESEVRIQNIIKNNEPSIYTNAANEHKLYSLNMGYL